LVMVTVKVMVMVLVMVGTKKQRLIVDGSVRTLAVLVVKGKSGMKGETYAVLCT